MSVEYGIELGATLRRATCEGRGAGCIRGFGKSNTDRADLSSSRTFRHSAGKIESEIYYIEYEGGCCDDDWFHCKDLGGNQSL